MRNPIGGNSYICDEPVASSMTWQTHSPSETEAAGAVFARGLKEGDVVALIGDLGSGKTCFVKGAAAGLGVTSGVSSPTFTLVNAYSGPMPVYHMDAYRLKSADELLHIGFEDYLSAGGVCFIEWADKVGALLPSRTLTVRFSADEGDGRLIEACGNTRSIQS